MIHLVDANNFFRRELERPGSGSANNFFRRELERPGSGSALRNLLLQVENSPWSEVWVWDGYNNLPRRRAIYPAYKTKRLAPPEDIKAAREIFQEVLLHTKVIQVRVPEYEADDVIAAIVGKYGAVEHFRIDSTDRDLLQLTTLDNVQVLRDPVPNVAGSEIRLWKTLRGDQSDNITGIPGFGPKAWLACNKDAFFQILQLGRSIEPDSIEGLMEHFGITKRCATWLQSNESELRAMWSVIGFIDVPWNLVADNSIAGNPDPGNADQVLKRHMH